jgi:hypothetical protein
MSACPVVQVWSRYLSFGRQLWKLWRQQDISGESLQMAATVVSAQVCVRHRGTTELLDMSGRLVARLRSGWNDASRFARVLSARS